MKITIVCDKQRKCFVATGTCTADDGAELSKSMDIEYPEEMTLDRLYSILCDDLSEMYLDMKSPLM